MNMLIFVVCVLDLRQKLNYLEFALSEMYDSKKCSDVRQKLKDTLYEVYDNYKPQASSDFGQSNVENNSSLSEPKQKVKRCMKELYKRCVIEASGKNQTYELDKYLGEASEKYDDGFDFLLCWKVNIHRFSTLSKMIKDVLTIPLSTVASKFTFSIRGCVHDQFRSSLIPKMALARVYSRLYSQSINRR
ncbi:hypothetical protein GQ457_07G000800 [Hibiscus cannabinus]